MLGFTKEWIPFLEQGAGAMASLTDEARKAGAIGGKLLGAGGGGFLLVYAEPEQQEAVRKANPGMKEVPFAWENQGSRIVFYQPGSK